MTLQDTIGTFKISKDENNVVTRWGYSTGGMLRSVTRAFPGVTSVSVPEPSPARLK